MNEFRLLDLPPMTAAENMALDETLLELRGKGRSRDTLRFLRFSPLAVLVGYHQCVAQEVRLDYCRQNNIHINRRITGGGAILFDESQLGWEVICGKSFLNSSFMTFKLLKRLCETAVGALSDFGLQALFRDNNDVEINGRKISGTGGTELYEALLFQGTLLVDFDVDTMLKSLKIPVEKLKAKEIDSVKERVTCLKWELGYVPPLADIKKSIWENFERSFGVRLTPAGLTPEEEDLFNEKLPHFRSDSWINRVDPKFKVSEAVSSSYKTKAGIVRYTLVVDLHRNILKSIYITGDFLSYPSRALYDLEAALRQTALEKTHIKQIIRARFSNGGIVIPDMDCEEFLKPLDQVFEKIEINRRYGIPIENCNRISVTNGSFEEVVGKDPSVLLLPYCSKNIDCALRYKKGCGECGECTVGTAKSMGGEGSMTSICVTSFEDLIDELKAMRKRGVRAFIGCCCEPFYTKHVDDFEEVGVPGILLDIDNTTCYELDQAKDAYKGEFARQTKVNLPLLECVLKVVHENRTL
jgi:lipoate-protein ligase A